MASLTRKPNGYCTIGFTDPDGKPRWIYPGAMPRRAAEQIVRHVEALLAAKVAGSAVPVDTARWLADAGDTLYEKLARTGLVPYREKPQAKRLDELCNAYLSKRTDVKPRTIESMKRAVTSLVGHFGAERDYSTITRAEALDWKRADLEKFAQATVANNVKKSRQIFADAVDAGLLATNPFVGVKAGSQANPDRLHYVPAATIEAVMAACDDPEWALAFALARFGGLRCPSETSALRWPDVDWINRRITVTSPKGERHGKGRRVIPLFSELQAPLLRMWEVAADKAGAVLPTLGGESLATRGRRFIRRAGFEPWQRTFQNLRASRETDLARLYPIQVVCAWIGNTPAVAVAHYLSVTEEDYQSAAGAQNGAAPVPLVLPMFGEQPPDKGAETAEQTPKMGTDILFSGLEHPLNPRGILAPSARALDPALAGLTPPVLDTAATALDALSAAVAARAGGSVARG